MSTRCHLSYFRFCLCLLVVAMLSGCASRKIVTSVEDQSYVPGPTPKPKRLGGAKMSPADRAIGPPPVKADTPPVKKHGSRNNRLPPHLHHSRRCLRPGRYQNYPISFLILTGL